ncbi:hypothetical protein GWI33_007151 [Rhynchophorus ferrugineus]|uniref:Uncharacterized protein n=1 Tax=Rhynchophorus ferrugineus TaxID=354439 RepID=A0A834IUB3_RHYFE|nr:hypothetical protein GWI33_007151 [Rhynchophorus ferrugineus]
MSYKILVVSCILAVVYSASVKDPVAIISQNSDIRPDGSFDWIYEAADGSKHQQKASVKQVGKETATTLEGIVSWVDLEGHRHEISYVADENGYQARGADLPVAPEVPKAIVRALEWIAAHPEPEKKH